MCLLLVGYRGHVCWIVPEVASGMLGSQEEHMKRSQKEILDDITTVRHNIQTVWGRIGGDYIYFIPSLVVTVVHPL